MKWRIVMSITVEQKTRSLQQLYNRMVASKTTGDKLPKFALLAGAGCSISSGVVSGSRIIDILQKYTYLINTDNADSELLATWNHERETLEAFISKVEHLINTNSLQEYIAAKHTEHQHQYEDLASRFKLLNTLPNSIKKQYPDVFYCPKEKITDLSSSINEIWLKYCDHFLAELQYGFWMYQYSPVSDNIQALIEEFIEYKNPSIEYFLFADLIAKGMLYNIFTTNFDDFFQESLSFLGMRARICAFGDKADVIDFTRKKPNIIKLHGDYLYNNTKNYNSETTELHTSLKSKFQEGLMKFGMIVVGYAGNDYSIMSVLEELKERLDYPLYWCVLESDLKDGKLPWRATELILNTNDSFFVPIKSFNHFTHFLWQHLSRTETTNQHITSSFITYAFEKAANLSEQLKRIFSEENPDVRLTDGVPFGTLSYDYSKLIKAPTISPLSTFDGEISSFQGNGFVHLQEAVQYFDNLNPEKKEIAKHIIQLVGDFVFLNARYLTFLLNEEGVQIQQGKTLKALQQLSQVNILAKYKFSTPTMKSKFYVFSLDFNGDKLYRQLFKARPQWHSTYKLTTAVNVKRYLATAQVISTLKRYIGNFNYQISPKLGPNQGGVRPSATFQYSKNGVEYRYLLEVVRKSPDWENEALDKLKRYNSYLSNTSLKDNSRTLLIFCCESQDHIEALYKICDTWREYARDKMIFNQLDEQFLWFSEDIGFLSDNLSNTFTLLYHEDKGNILTVPIDLNSYFVIDDTFIQNCSLSSNDMAGILSDNIEESVPVSYNMDLYNADILSESYMSQNIPFEYSQNTDLDNTLREKIIQTCLALGKVGEPLALAQFALKLKENGIDYHDYGVSKLIHLLKRQNDYISIEGTDANKYIVLLNNPLSKQYIEEHKFSVEKTEEKHSTAKSRDASSEISFLLNNIYLGHIPSLLKQLTTLAGYPATLNTLAKNYRFATLNGTTQSSINNLSFYTGFQHPSKGELYMRCTTNDRTQPWKFDSFFYLNTSTQ